ncbi:MAG: T9SS type A sorting domain-containing protein, partial [Bacteroidia bacterium]
DTGFVTEGFTGNDLYKTVNGGQNWQRDTRIETAFYFNYFPNRYHWILYGGVGQIWETTDNGNSWTEISNDVPSGFGRFQAPREWLGYAVGGFGLILKYQDTSYVPVNLISFEGKIENNKIILNWQTATELNNKGFEIEKSFDKENWFTLGFVEGGGTTTNLNYYSFTDNEIPSEIQYYRLKQLDFNGSFEYSKVIEVNSDLTITSYQLFQNYPNPFNSLTIINYQVPVKSQINISIYDIKGEKILELVNEEKEKGLYKTALENVKLPSGIYFVRMITSTGYSAVIKITQIK